MNYLAPLLGTFFTGSLMVLGQIPLESIPFQKLTLKSDDGTTEDPLFRLLAPEDSGVDFQIQLPDMVRFSHELLHLSLMGGLAVGDFDADGWTDFYVPSPQGGGRLFRNEGGLRFSDVTEISGLSNSSSWETGAGFVDIDNDGDLDLVICSYQSPNRVFLNKGKDTNEAGARFEEKAKLLGLDFTGASMQMSFADIDLDGDLDAYLATTAAPPPAGVEFRVEFEGSRPVIPKELREYWELLYLPGEKAHRTEAGQYDRLYRNDNGRFIDVTETSGISGAYFTLCSIWFDCDQDGWPDLYVANDYLGPDRLYINQKDGTFKDFIQEWAPHIPWSSMGLSQGDLNNDGLFDLIATDMLGSTHYRRNVMLGESSRMEWFFDYADPPQYSRNAVLLNTGMDRFQDAAYLTGMAATDWTWAPLVADLDGDGREDVYFTNGMLRDVQHTDLGSYADRTYGGGSRAWAEYWSKQPLLKETNHAFRNQGELDFKEIGPEWGLNLHGVSFGSAAADFDRDGDLDLLIVHADQKVSVLENRSQKSNHIQVQLQGKLSNSFGIGATIQIEAGGLRQSRYLNQSRGWLTGVEPAAQFGIGELSQVDQLAVTWPSGQRQIYKNLAANHLYVVREDREELPFPKTSTQYLGQTPAPLPLEDNSKKWFAETRQWNLPETPASPMGALLEQPLTSFKRMQSHIAVAWADLNGDGLLDLFRGGGLGVAGQILFQQADSSFKQSVQIELQKAEAGSDVGAVFSDWNGDGFQDLFVARFNVQSAPAAQESSTQLYFGNAQGRLKSASKNLLPMNFGAVGCLASGDVDGDGDLDLFLGGSSITGKYPIAEASYLWIWNGERFEDQSPAGFQKLGMISAAEFVDVNGDGQMDLAMASHLGPIRVWLQQEKSVWKDVTEYSGMSGRKSWWRSIHAVDVDLDGDQDLVVGSLGRNTKYQTRNNEVNALLYGKFGSGNNKWLALEAYQESGRIYLSQGFEAISRVLPELRKNFKSFHDWSSSSVDQIFDAQAMRSIRATVWNSVESGIWIQEESMKFRFQPFPAEAQLSTVNCIVSGDFNHDGWPDLAMGQNDFTFVPGNGRVDSGLGAVLMGIGEGKFRSLNPTESGIRAPEEVRRVDWLDLNRDGALELVFTEREGGFRIFSGVSPR